MKCPICGSSEVRVLKSKETSSRSKKINDYLLKCKECDHVFKDRVTQSKPIPCRLIVSENEKSTKTTVDLYPDEKLKIGDVLLIDKGQVKINSIENKEKRVNSELVSEIKTIWASSLEIPARLGLSIDFHGKVKSYKLDINRDFEINTNDIIKIENFILKVHIIKTENKKITSGSAKADVIKRIYTKTINLKTYDYDLTDNIVKIKSDDI
ncbi:HVO_0476 family zinc finger protein [uncultured Methanobrevibacter sp.]|uniref:HVO_0476 family zinc finger protein n=1 Tax=uncultured Methanobrevibacter sp. TaxID=253161 RepID=UPI0025E078D2|nr:HVO_0476 family zinc finger protein [uncultured Methanobrevibacter sp.]